MRFALPPRGSPARLPVLLVPVLAVLALVQIVLPAPVDLPPVAGALTALATHAPADPPPVFVPAALANGGLFAPAAGTAGGPGAAVPTDPLGGVTIAGVVQRGRQSLALVTGPGASMHYVATGGVIAGWRLVTLGPASALLRRGKDHLDLTYGAHAVAAASPVSADKNR